MELCTFTVPSEHCKFTWKPKIVSPINSDVKFTLFATGVAEFKQKLDMFFIKFQNMDMRIETGINSENSRPLFTNTMTLK